MIQIDLAAVPNQSFSIRLDNNLYDITITDLGTIMSATIVKNNETLLSNTRIVNGSLIIPYSYLEDGNFFITSDDNDIPYYTEFNITQFLYYVSQAELAALRAGV